MLVILVPQFNSCDTHLLNRIYTLHTRHKWRDAIAIAITEWWILKPLTKNTASHVFWSGQSCKVSSIVISLQRIDEDDDEISFIVFHP
jgi:hypothetical protein